VTKKEEYMLGVKYFRAIHTGFSMRQVLDWRVVSLALLLAVPQVSIGEKIKQVKAEKQGMSSERLEGLSQLNQQYVADGKVAGVMTMVARHGKIVHLNAAGHYGVDNDKPLAEDTLFRIYSMSKPITAVALMMLYEEGAFQLKDPVSKFLPQFANMKVWKDGEEVAAEKQITMHQLLTHTSGLTYGFHKNNPVDARYQDDKLLDSKDNSDFIDKLTQIPLLFEPGERWNYSVASDVLGAVAEKISGQSYDEFLTQRIFKPLGMKDTFFNVPEEKLARFATNHYWNPKEKKLGALNESAMMNNFTEQTWFSGGGGLVSSIGDYMKFAEMLRRGGEFNGTRILSPKTVQYMVMNHLPATVAASGSGELSVELVSNFKGTGFGLGFGVMTDPVRSGLLSSEGTYYWGGAASTVFWIDPEEDLVAIGMMQLMGSPWAYRNEMMINTYQAIEELND
jgi:CubicO group peptidase (beta-lactamase class C family)